MLNLYKEIRKYWKWQSGVNGAYFKIAYNIIYYLN